MARQFAQLHTSIWEDADFMALTPDARWVYVAAFSQKIVNYCGVMVYSPHRLASVTGLPVKRVDKAVAELHGSRFVVADMTSGELLIRSFIKSNNVLSQPQLRKAMERCFDEVLSLDLKREILAALPDTYNGPLRKHPAAQPAIQGAAQAAGEPADDPALGARIMDTDGYQYRRGVTTNRGSEASPERGPAPADAVAPMPEHLRRSKSAVKEAS